MPSPDPILTILDSLVHESDQALEAGEVGPARALLDLARVVLVAALVEPSDLSSIGSAVVELVDTLPELAHLLGEVGDLVDELSRREAGCTSPEEPCDACLAGLACPVPGCADLVELGDPAGPW